MTKELQECINSGQVSAAQCVAHQEAGELTVVAWQAHYKDRAGRDVLYTTSNGELAIENDDRGSPCELVRLSDAQAHAAQYKAALEAEREKVNGLREALERSVVALDDWTHTYAPELCNPVAVKDAWGRINERGTLYYIAEIQQANADVLTATQEPKT
jgi:hypothetical protein